jgi:N-acetylated-alpha-linked acidic dipeptidase
MNNKIVFFLLLWILLLAGFRAEAGTKRILVVGDSWAALMTHPIAGNIFQATLKKSGFEEIEVVATDDTAVPGSRADQWAANHKGKLDNLKKTLAVHPTVDIVFVVIGGNDFLKEAISRNLSTLPAEERKTLWQGIGKNIRVLVDAILECRSDLRVVLCDYDYLNLAAAAQSPMKQTFHGISQADFNQYLVDLGREKRSIAEKLERCLYIQNWGLMQHHFGDEMQKNAPKTVALPGGAARFDPYPGGDPTKPGPAAAFQQPAGNDGIHLNAEGYRLLIANALNQGLGRMLKRLSENSILGSTGYQPVPSGDSPDGRASVLASNLNARFPATTSPIPVGGSPTGTGESPVPPLLQTAAKTDATTNGKAPPDSPLLGFTHSGTQEERALEAKFDAMLNRDNLRAWMKQMSARPHHVGSPFGKENADFMASQFRAWGFETEIERFEILFPTPKMRRLEMLEPERFTARLAEPALKEDTTSGLIEEQLPTYNAYSIDGDVTGQLVFVNYGIPKDYEMLAERGIDVRGKIVIARYGSSWRGIKPKVAAEHGAIGCLIYSDPKDDGYSQGDVYPVGAWRNEHGAQRGSVADMPLYPGDPLTPGVGATKDAKRLPIKEAPTLTKIPVLPISYGDALPLLRALGGPVAPEAWRGGLPITYHLGPGPATVRLQLEFDWKLATAYNVLAKLRGAEHPEAWVIRGNHHDAWVFGADDPLSGMVALMEEARAVGALAQGGWRPKRTIVYAAWDAEEPGLLGSTEWVETHAELLRKNAVLYVNSDNSGRGFLRAGGSHTLERLVNEIAREVIDPQKKVTVAERLRANRKVRGDAEERREAGERSEFRIGALGSGSDYSPFLQHLGIPSLDIRYSGENAGGSYHSIYDSFDHYVRFGDPDFAYGIALAQTAGRAILRAANAEVLPFEYLNMADTIARYAREVAKLADDLREETRQQNQLIRDKSLELIADPKETYIVPKPKSPVPFLNFAPLQNAVVRLQASARNYDSALTKLKASDRALSLEARKELDVVLIATDRALVRSEGLPRRPWYKHQIYAPGFYTGYGVKTLPGIREALEQRNWPEATKQTEITSKTIERFADEIDRASKLLGPTF